MHELAIISINPYVSFSEKKKRYGVLWHYQVSNVVIILQLNSPVNQKVSENQCMTNNANDMQMTN